MRWSTDELILEIFRTKDGNFNERQLSRDDFSFCVVQDGPDGYLCAMVIFSRINVHKETIVRTYKIFQLSSRLFNNCILTTQDNTHATEIADLSPTYD